MCSIDWCSFTWQAFATLFTGIAATGGAVFIGTRQLAINREQVTVAAGQARIAELQAQTARMAQRSALFDKRYGVYEVIQKYLVSAMSVKAEEHFLDQMQPLRRALDESNFLFPPAVRESIKLALNAADEYADANAEIRDAGPLPPEDPLLVKRRDMRKVIRETLGTLADAMGEEMRLYTDTTSSVSPPS